MKFAFIYTALANPEARQGQWTANALCRILGVSRSGYGAWRGLAGLGNDGKISPLRYISKKDSAPKGNCDWADEGLVLAAYCGMGFG